MPFNQSPIKILIVEDNAGDVLLFREVLNDTGLNIESITEATDLKNAKKILTGQKPDLIFLDLSLPDCSGIESFLFIQQHSGPVPIVILTGSNDTALALEAINKGAQDFLIKEDVDEKLLAKTILYSIERKRIAESLQLSNERYHLVSIATNDMVWDWDLLKNKVFRSQSGWDKLFGEDQYDQSTHPDSWWDRVHPEDKEYTTAKIRQVLDNKHIDQFEIECRIHTGNNNYAHVVDRGYAIRNEQGDAVRLIGVTQNVTDKKRSEEEVKRLSIIAKETLNAIIITDPDGYIQWVNEAFNNISGYSSEEALGKKPAALLQGPETSPVVKRYMRMRIKSVKPFECDVVNYKKTGEKYWIRIQCQPQFDDKGKLTSFFAVQTNITVEKEAEEKLVASEKRFRSIIEKSNEGLALLNADGIVLDMSPAGRKILGYPNEYPFLMKESAGLVYPEDEAVVAAAFKEVVQKHNHVKIIEYRLKKASGNFIWVESTFHNLLQESAINAIVLHFRDISSRKLFEDVLKNSEEKYRNLFNINPSSIFIWDLHNFSIIEINDAAVQEYGYSRKEFLKLTLHDLLLVKDDDDFKDLSANLLSNEKYKSNGTWQHVTKNGSARYMDITFQAIDYYGKKACLAIVNNISDKIELEKKLAEERLKKQHDITAAVITAQEQEREDLGKELHDNINQILATTKLYIEYALANDAMRETLLNSAKDFIASAVNELRSLSKSLLPPSLGQVGLKMALNELVDSIQVVNKFRLHINWNDLDDSLLPEQLKLTIFRIIQEQLNNIIKHAGANNVWIKIKLANKRLKLDIKDDGKGFNMVHKSNGVGLKNILSRAELHNGSMTLKSAEGKGCELTLLFNL